MRTIIPQGGNTDEGLQTLARGGSEFHGEFQVLLDAVVSGLVAHRYGDRDEKLAQVVRHFLLFFENVVLHAFVVLDDLGIHLTEKLEGGPDKSPRLEHFVIQLFPFGLMAKVCLLLK